VQHRGAPHSEVADGSEPYVAQSEADPELTNEEWPSMSNGEGTSPTATATEPAPFRIEVADEQLTDLRQRLASTRWPDGLPGVGWQYGVPLDYLRELAEDWRTRYDWRAWEARLNAWAQFTTTIDGARVHFAHLRSPEPHALPLIVTHGWPGSIAEFLEVAGPLADPRGHGGDPRDAFHVVIPSIPGFGFSGPTTEPGWDNRRVAAAWATLMERLGYRRWTWDSPKSAMSACTWTYVHPEADMCPPAGRMPRELYTFRA
jgi:hypothetical protein